MARTQIEKKAVSDDWVRQHTSSGVRNASQEELEKFLKAVKKTDARGTAKTPFPTRGGDSSAHWKRSNQRDTAISMAEKVLKEKVSEAFFDELRKIAESEKDALFGWGGGGQSAVGSAPAAQPAAPAKPLPPSGPLNPGGQNTMFAAKPRPQMTAPPVKTNAMRRATAGAGWVG